MAISKRATPVLASAVGLQGGAAAAECESLLDTEAPATYSSGKHKLRLVWSELPEWMKDNHYILSGYRAPTNSFRKCFASLLYVHNETGNIMTHVAGALGFVALCFTVTTGLLAEFPTIDWRDVTTLYVFLVAAVACLGISAVYHTVTCHSHSVQRTYNRCDYVGIVLLIVGSCVPVFCYMFYCHPRLKLLYLGLISALGAITAYVVVAPHFATPAYRPLRVATFVALGLSGIVPGVHSWWLFGWEYTLNAVQVPYMLLMGATYIVGATLYGARIPERWWPGRFDYWLHSHQIFHIFVVAAAAVHYAGVARALRWTHTVGLGLCAAVLPDN
ncbi:hypothetical protein GGI04_001444 [Coemansia thaxteri]|uniref:Uncharacterized protein n=1 Tax=Coemansia thaxteri TaxID=2663907 RepID=A0A9W8EKT3_9FUNG|nr:hypothetical protein H4R26_001095 [Coemansia thaxteri]KAJ2007657.1 hypothetical protein GGI04_001444 [Coemansia thaxteri]KAJ2465246.1 hypothetical protein GGI02_004754 [Coemansia sp. RSA 2322]KAJ2485198.1 hypothetical protein EV174_001889 [Coemansia sp. RSA 2320]